MVVGNGVGGCLEAFEIAIIPDAPGVLAVAAAQPAVGEGGIEAGCGLEDVELVVDARVEVAAGAGVDGEHARLVSRPRLQHGPVALVQGEADTLVGRH